MDDPALDPTAHREALKGLKRINRVSRSAALLWHGLEPLVARKRRQARPWRVLDLACGAGDVTLELARRARARGVAIELAGCDASETALAEARQAAAEANEPITFFRADVLEDRPEADFDAVVSNLFLHHLPALEAEALLRRLGEFGLALVMNDLDRSLWHLWLAHAGVRLLSRSPVVRIDGPRSVYGAFTRKEVWAMAGRAGLEGARVQRAFALRWLLVWEGEHGCLATAQRVANSVARGLSD